MNIVSAGSLMCVSVLVIGFTIARHLFERYYAAMQFMTANMLELNSRMANGKMLFEHMIQLEKNAGAF